MYAALGAGKCRGQADYLLHRIANEDGRIPTAFQMPAAVLDTSGPKPGLGPLLARMTERDPVFLGAYIEFLRHLDDLNTRLAQAGGGRFRQQAAMPGLGQFARALEAMGGESKVTPAANGLCVTWDTLMAKSRQLAAAALRSEEVTLHAPERRLVVDLLALGQLAAVSNRVIPSAYVAEWEHRHPDRPRPPSNPPAGVSPAVWHAVRNALPWVYHSGALPWPSNSRGNPHEAYDICHFFSHAWLVYYNLYRDRYAAGATLRRVVLDGEAEKIRVRVELARSTALGVGYEVATTFALARTGFADITSAEHLPESLKLLCRCLHVPGLPVVEAVRDIRMDHAGAVYGAALFLSGLPLAPSEVNRHTLVVGRSLQSRTVRGVSFGR
jgi:hypothetical protein